MRGTVADALSLFTATAGFGDEALTVCAEVADTAGIVVQLSERTTAGAGGTAMGSTSVAITGLGLKARMLLLLESSRADCGAVGGGAAAGEGLTQLR